MSADEKHQEIVDLHAAALELAITTTLLNSAKRMDDDNLNEHEKGSIVGGVLMDKITSFCSFTMEPEAAISMFARLLHAAAKNSAAKNSAARQPPAGEA